MRDTQGSSNITDRSSARRRVGRSLTLVLPVLLLCGGVSRAEHVACPACEERSRCVPGVMAGRVVCAGAEGISEHENVTAFCLSCHQEGAKGAQEAETRQQAPKMTRMHPMEVKYPRRSRSHRPIGELYKGIQLTDGKVTCLSCHGGRESSNHYLSNHPRNPNLCTHCHLK